MPKLEIAALTLADALAAQDGGADSIEISRDLSVGGLTPDFDLVHQVRDAVNIGVNVMIRPHAETYVYSAGDIAEILDNACTLAHLGVDGVVFGALTPERRLDLALIEEVASEAIPLALTVHRALDESLEPDAWSGRFALAEWVRDHGDQFSFVVSGGLKLEQVPEMLATVKAQEYHFGSATRTNNAVDVAKVRALKAALAQNVL
jgi:copper homeostasis protein